MYFVSWARVHSYDVIYDVQCSVLQINTPLIAPFWEKMAEIKRIPNWQEVMQLPLIISSNFVKFEVSKVCSLKVGVA